jgi:hypothetical protein
MLIRPDRATYDEFSMDEPIIKEVNGTQFSLSTFLVKNGAGDNLSCSFVEPTKDIDRSADKMPCIIYLHGEDTNKREGLSFAEYIIPQGINLCCFDFSGCGNSQGDWVTLGYKE